MKKLASLKQTFIGCAAIVIMAAIPTVSPAEEKPDAATATVEAPAAAAQRSDEGSYGQIVNDFLKVVVNTGEKDTGRFLAETVKGDPSRDNDDNKILIYGGALPWTSFTTLRVDGSDYVYGGSTRRRAGKSAKYGEAVTPPHVEGGAISSTYKIAGLDVTQTLSFTGGPISRLYDTIQIKTTIHNSSSDARKVGMRLLIDTLLGSNDGSPFKVGDRSITSETEFSGDAIPEYWIAYDSLENPGVVARGTLRGPGLTVPDRIVMAHWGKFADSIYSFDVASGASFTGEGDDGPDSAVGLYWNERTVAPGDSVTFSTYYGIEYLDTAGDMLALGAQRSLGEWSTARNQIRPYTVYVYVQNNMTSPLNDVEIKLTLPNGIEFSAGNDAVKKIASLAPGEERTLGWSVQPKAGAGGDRTLTIRGSSREVSEVILKTKVELVPPPEVKVSLTAPDKVARAADNKFGPYGKPFEIKVKCLNPGRFSVDNLRAKLILPEGTLEFPPIEKSLQQIKQLKGGDYTVFTWNINATGRKTGKVEYKVVIESDTTDSKTVTGAITIDPLAVNLTWNGIPEKMNPGHIFPAELFVNNIETLGKADFAIKFDPAVVEAVRISQGTLFVENGTMLSWNDPHIDNAAGIVSGISAARKSPVENHRGSLITIHFMAVNPGKSPITIDSLKLLDNDGNPIAFEYQAAEANVVTK